MFGPKHLVKQRKSEIGKFVPELLENIIAIEDPRDFAELTANLLPDARELLCGGFRKT